MGRVGSGWGRSEGAELEGENKRGEGSKKLENSRAQPPPTSPRNGYARIQNIMHGAV